MGKSVTVKPGFSYVEGPSPKGPRSYATGATIVYTDAEYAALPASITRCLSAPTNVADPSRPASDPSAQPVTSVNPASGTVQLALGANALLLTGNVTVVFPVASQSGPTNQGVFTSTPGPVVGEVSAVELYLTQDGTGSRVLTLPASAQAAGGTDPVLSTGANAVDYLRYVTIDGGATWKLVNKQLNLS